MDTWEVIVVFVAVAGWVLAFAGSWTQGRRTTARQLAALQRKLDLVMDHLGIAEAAPERSAVVRHLESGKPIDAVRAYRRLTGASLVDAKQAVDRIAGERRPAPDR